MTPYDNHVLRFAVQRTAAPARSLALAAWVLGGCALAGAQQATNAPARMDYDAFKAVADRNVFDATRQPHRSRSFAARQGPEADWIALVGTLSSAKGTFAFFDSTQTDCRKALQVRGALATYSVESIAPDRVTLSCGGTQLEMRVGARIHHENSGAWRLVVPDDATAEATGMAAVATAPAGVGGSAAPAPEVSDVLRKLMQQREQELK